MSNLRTIQALITPQMISEGAGVRLLRSFAPRQSNLYDPFLLFDHFAFNDLSDDPIPGFPMHPHRGIETVTYLLEGSVRHGDNLGNSGEIAAGDVQWMTSGRGILHEEMPKRNAKGQITGFQLWVNLPAAQKMTHPRYQEVRADQIPILKQNGLEVRLVAGSLDGVAGPVKDIAIAPLYMEARMNPGARFSIPVNREHTVLLYLFSGSIRIAEQSVEKIQMVVIEDGDVVEVESGMQGARFMLISGKPIREPIAPYGPFVMNTMEEIQQALVDLRNGTFVKS
ncbi:MAG TPA: pirin family protein [Anaerolineaceae bacterium]